MGYPHFIPLMSLLSVTHLTQYQHGVCVRYPSVRNFVPLHRLLDTSKDDIVGERRVVELKQLNFMLT